MAKADLTAERVRELLDYSADTGKFTWRVKRSNVSAGAPAGNLNVRLGYVQIGIDHRLWYGHRLAWLHTHGHWPVNHIDHINGDKADNRLANLRDVDHSTNLQNLRRPMASNTTSGILGVCWSTAEGKWVANISVKNRTVFVGQYADKDEAANAYLAAKRRLHAGCML